MRVLVTGAMGKVGSAAARSLLANHEVVCTDLVQPNYDRLSREPGAMYIQADLREPGDAFIVTRGCDAIVHCAAIPTDRNNTPHNVFRNNLLATFNLAEAAVSLGVTRVVNISSAAVASFASMDGRLPPYLPIDEDQPIYPHDSYSLTKYFGEQITSSITRRSSVRCISLRPCWTQRASDYGSNLGPGIRVAEPRLSRWSYVDIDDLADAIVLATESALPDHEEFYIAAAENAIGQPLEDLASIHFGGRLVVKPAQRTDASSVSSEKAYRLLGYVAKRSWRDYLRPDGTEVQ